MRRASSFTPHDAKHKANLGWFYCEFCSHLLKKILTELFAQKLSSRNFETLLAAYESFFYRFMYVSGREGHGHE